MIEILKNVDCLETTIKNYKKSAKDYYFEVLFNKFRCPQCAGVLRIIGPSTALCECGFIVDPTIEFQKSNCCNKSLVKKICHYACSKCGKTVRSLFLFNERLFDSLYFSEMVAKSRRQKRRMVALQKARIRYRSGDLLLLSKIDLSRIEKFETDLDEFVSDANKQADSDDFDTGNDFDLLKYWRHISRQIGSNEMFFSEISPIFNDSRQDRARCFTALVFMEHERQIWMTEYGDDILVERYEAHFEG